MAVLIINFVVTVLAVNNLVVIERIRGYTSYFTTTNVTIDVTVDSRVRVLTEVTRTTIITKVLETRPTTNLETM